MKKEALLILIFIFTITITSAAYTCSSNGTIEEDQGKINIKKVEFINKIGIGVINTNSGHATDILIDAKSITLTNETPSIEVKLLSGNYDVDLISITENTVEIKIEGDKEEINKEEIKKVDDLQVYVTDVSGTYPGNNTFVKLIVGIDNLFLHDDKLTELKTIGGIEYLFEFFSSSSNYAIMVVKKCDSGNLVEIAETPPVNTTSTNTTNTTEPLINTPSTNTNNQIQNITYSSDKKDSSLINKILLIVISIIAGVVILIILILYFKNKPHSY